MAIENQNSVFKDVDLSLLKYFFVVATFGGFSRAARATGQSQPALSQGLQKLEKSLGVLLVTRDSHQFNLTEDGQRLFEFCRFLEGSLENVVSSMGKTSSPFSRRIRLGTAFSIGFGPLVNVCARAAKMEERIEIELETHNTFQVIDEVKKGYLDAGLVPDDVYDPSLTMTKVFADRITVIAAPHVKLDAGSETWRSVLYSKCLVTYMRETTMRALVDRILMRERIEFRSSISSNSVDALKMLVEEGAGVAFILRSLVESELQRGVLKEVSLPISLPKRSIVLATRSDDKGDSISEMFLKLISATKATRA